MPRARFLILCLCLCLALAAPATAFADASARVLSVTPGVRYSLAGAGQALSVKMDVPVRAVVVSDATGKAQLMFPDDSTLSIAPDTQISLAEYVDAEREENIVLDLVSGTARIITGESNRKNPQAFTVNTPQASIGIRGTLVTIQAGGDVTRVYLSETSGKGVSVHNLGTGQVMELRKPGTIINVGANFMEERKAQKEEAASFSAALRGKSRAEIERATARAQGAMRAAAGAGVAPGGDLPPAGAADPVQLAALTSADRLDHASLVADAVPVVPEVPEAPSVPVLPADPVLPEPDLAGYLLTLGGDWAGSGTGTVWTSDVPEAANWGLSFTIPSQYKLDEVMVLTDVKFSNSYAPTLPNADAPIHNGNGQLKINSDGSFTSVGVESFIQNSDFEHVKFDDGTVWERWISSGVPCELAIKGRFLSANKASIDGNFFGVGVRVGVNGEMVFSGEITRKP